MMTSQFIAVHSNEYAVVLMCSVLEVAVSGYYAWRKREPGRHSREDAFLAEKIVEAFQHNRRFPRLFY
jgi:putative transposase